MTRAALSASVHCKAAQPNSWNWCPEKGPRFDDSVKLGQWGFQTTTSNRKLVASIAATKAVFGGALSQCCLQHWNVVGE